MGPTAPTEGRTVAVRLTDVPLVIRRRYGRRLIDAAIEDGDLTAAIAFTRAVETPSDRVYWVPDVARQRVLGP